MPTTIIQAGKLAVAHSPPLFIQYIRSYPSISISSILYSRPEIMKGDQVLHQYSIRQQEIYYCVFKVWILNQIQRDENLIRNACDTNQRHKVIHKWLHGFRFHKAVIFNFAVPTTSIIMRWDTFLVCGVWDMFQSVVRALSAGHETWGKLIQSLSDLTCCHR